jgi:hypothetical protein
VADSAPQARPLRVILFGATGMVGSAVLGQCLADPDVEAVLSVSRRPGGRSHPRLRELLHQDFFDYSGVTAELKGYDACFFALGLSSVGRSETEYTRDTYELAVSAAKALLEANPGMSFCYVSGQGTDSTEKGPVMWARVKGRTENALLAMPFSHAAMIRLGALQPPPGFRSRTAWIRWAYVFMAPLLPLLKLFGNGLVLDGPTLGRAMIRVAQGKADKTVLLPRDVYQLGRAS